MPNTYAQRPMPTGLARSYRGDTLTALADGAAVTTWTSPAGGRTLTPRAGATGITAPTKTTTMGAQPAVRFAGSNQLDTPAGSSTPAVRTVAAILNLDAGTDYRFLVDHTNAYSITLAAGQWRATTTATLVSGPAPTGPCVVAVVMNGAASRWHINGEPRAVGTLADGAGYGSFLLGGDRQSSSYSLRASLAELLIYDRALTAPELAQVASYAQDRYAITVAGYVPPPSSGPTFEEWNGSSAAPVTFEGEWTGAAVRATTFAGEWDGTETVP